MNTSSGRPAQDAAFVQRYGPWAVVTGASDGIGAALAEQLAGRGMALVLVARRHERLQALAARLSTAHGVACRVVVADLADLEATHRLAEAVADLDVGLLVACAGFGRSGPLLATNLAENTEMVDLNCNSVLAQCWHFGARLVQRGRGGVILMSSLVGFQGAATAANYAATKAYVQALAEGLQQEWKAAGIDVLAVAPGPVHTGFAARAGMHMTQAATPADVARAALSALRRGGTLRPGWLAKLLGWSLATAPRPLRVRIMGRVMAGMAAK
jgi:uncharacterized protein